MTILTLIAASALGLALWAWRALSEVDRALRAFDGFDSMSFEIGPAAAERARRA